MSISELHIKNELAMQILGRTLARLCSGACVIYLIGDLGAGKSTLARAFLRELGVTGTIKSPTYSLVELYEVAGRQLYHLDLYRLADPEELEYLGIRDWLGEGALSLVEWPQLGRGVLPCADLEITIDYAQSQRRVRIEALSQLGRKIQQQL